MGRAFGVRTAAPRMKRAAKVSNGCLRDRAIPHFAAGSSGVNSTVAEEQRIAATSQVVNAMVLQPLTLVLPCFEQMSRMLSDGRSTGAFDTCKPGFLAQNHFLSVTAFIVASALVPENYGRFLGRRKITTKILMKLLLCILIRLPVTGREPTTVAVYCSNSTRRRSRSAMICGTPLSSANGCS